jgi:hypothetical protein
MDLARHDTRDEHAPSEADKVGNVTSPSPRPSGKCELNAKRDSP